MDTTDARNPPPAPAAVVEWIRSAAIPLTPAEPRHGLADLAPLRAVIGDARIVSLGEATHGTREFFTLKHRLLELCVAELGFTMFCIEASFPESLAVNAYVLDGTGDPAAALANMRFWTWDTAEVLDLIEWMRWWNVHHDRKVKFYGFDMQYPTVAALGLIDYLDRVAPDLAAECRSELAPLASDVATDRFAQLAAARRDEAFACIARMREAFAQRREAWIAATGALDWHLGRLHASVLDQAARLRADLSSNVRDPAMAENVCALLEAEGPAAKAVLWAHNGHVARAVYPEDGKAMGKALDEMVGRAQVVIGFSFDRGAFQARSSSSELADHRIAGPMPGSLDAALAQAGLPRFALDLANAPRDGAVAAWLAAEMPMRSVGAVYYLKDDDAVDAAKVDPRYAMAIVPRAQFDAIVFVTDTTAARRNRALPAPQPLPIHDAPANLALAGDGVPAGWRLVGAERHKIDAVASGNDPAPSGGRTVRLTRDAGRQRWGDVRLVQEVAAQISRGQRVRFAAAIRTQCAGTGAGALLLMRFRKKPDDGGSSSLVRDLTVAASSDAPAQSPQWTTVAVEADVPDEAHSCVLALVMSGNGSAWFGDLAFTMVARAATT